MFCVLSCVLYYRFHKCSLVYVVLTDLTALSYIFLFKFSFVLYVKLCILLLYKLYYFILMCSEFTLTLKYKLCKYFEMQNCTSTLVIYSGLLLFRYILCKKSEIEILYFICKYYTVLIILLKASYLYSG